MRHCAGTMFRHYNDARHRAIWTSGDFDSHWAGSGVRNCSNEAECVNPRSALQTGEHSILWKSPASLAFASRQKSRVHHNRLTSEWSANWK